MLDCIQQVFAEFITGQKALTDLAEEAEHIQSSK
jgi:hypothetical protein